jgi:hypothetical protein
LFKIFYLLQTYIAIVLILILHMFHTYVSILCFICSSLLLQQVFSYCKLQVFYLDVASVCCRSFICYIQVFHVARVTFCSESQGARGSDGGAARVLRNGVRQAGGWRTWQKARWGRQSGARQDGVRLRGKVNGQAQGARMGMGQIQTDGADCK